MCVCVCVCITERGKKSKTEKNEKEKEKIKKRKVCACVRACVCLTVHQILSRHRNTADTNATGSEAVVIRSVLHHYLCLVRVYRKVEDEDVTGLGSAVPVYLSAFYRFLQVCVCLCVYLCMCLSMSVFTLTEKWKTRMSPGWAEVISSVRARCSGG